MSWENVELRDVSEYRTERIETNLLNETNYVSTENMLSDKGGIVDSSYPPSGNNSPSFKANDTLVSNIRPYFKKIWFAQNEGGCSNDVIVFKPNEEKINPKFLYFQLSKDEFFDYMMSGANGTKMPRGNKKAIPKFKFSIPTSLETQKRIASILSTYDDLIENNLKRIKLLEETAQNIYKEWFVNFRFPNYEHTEFDAESGLPVGWKKGKVADLCEVKSGYAFKSKDWQTEGNPVMKIKNITNNTVDITDCDFVDDEVAQSAEKFELFEGDVLIAMTGATVGKVGLIPKIDKRIYINQRVGLFRPFSEIENNVYLVFSFFMTDEAQKQILNFAGGAAQPNISSSQISEVELNIGSDEVLKMFESKIQSIMVQIQTLYSQNRKLKEARDILLPRLMNRTIKV
jgi:type I restriction enzyme S subunit